MRFKKVMLVNPAYHKTTFSMPVLPAGLGYIAEALKESKIDYRVVDLMLGYKLGFLERQIREFQPELIGFSMMSFMYLNVYKMIERLKNKFPHVKIAVGGPHVSSLCEAVLRECENIDFGIIQEGEKTMVELCSGVNLSEIRGLVYRENASVKFTGAREPVRDLDSLPFPKYEGFALDKYGFGMSLVSSRGCPYKCIFCSAHNTRKEYRARSPKNVVGEMEYWYKKGYREFGLQEDNPTLNIERAFELCDEIERKNFKDLILMCGNGVRADRVNRKLLTRMKEVGFKRLGFGIEGGNNKVLTSLKKGETIEDIKKAVETACELGFFVSIFFVVGSPSETPEDVQDSIDLALAYPVSNVRFSNLIPLPGTELFNWVEKNNYFIIKPEIYLNQDCRIQMSARPIFETPEFSAKERRRSMKKAKRVERYVEKKVIENRLIKLRPFNGIIAWLYTSSFVKGVENNLTHHEIFRRTVGKIRSKVRTLFYKI